MVRLDDGTYGVLPEEWLRRIGALAGMGKPEQGHVRFRHSQAGLLDALVAAQPEARCDETFARVREELRRFARVAPAAQPAGFVGQLRDYQSEGLGWMHFLQRFSFGGCLENHLGELWTLFEFLNPGMLGAANAFKVVGGSMRNPDEKTRRLLGHALRPFFLRRTKEQVARELPSKTEQTVYCELEPEQRKLYDQLRQHYRDSLLRRIETAGLAKSKIQVLEALLRLRQAACHPGLLDSKRSSDSSAKLDVLLEQLREVLDERHKALVFSQFTSLLKILRARLNQDGILYEYLDGATRDRQTRVERFQNDKDCRLFLVSLKAGGLGLNLTAAEYVFILDPWWNPAVEAQAVDRAHRIGQTRPVFTYRLIARDTVEEKVLELQKTKRDLAAAIMGAENSMIRDLRSEDLALLLS